MLALNARKLLQLQSSSSSLRLLAPRASRRTVCVKAATPCLVLSNDDGVESPALQSLAHRLRKETGLRVLVIAPSRNKSAASMGLTLRLDMELRARPELGPDTFALTGTPTDCMMVALDATKGLMRALDLHPIMALSGPNYGPNMGTDVLLSGTVGAARTAGLYGVPALASSSTSLDKSTALENAVDATVTLTELALSTLDARPARNWPRNHIVTGGLGRRHVHSSCDYEALPQNWVMDVEQVLVDAFQDGDVFLNLNVPAQWQAGHGVQTTGLGLMFYRDSYVVSVPGRAPALATMAAQQQPVAVGSTAGAAAAAAAAAANVAAAAANGNGNGNGNGAHGNGHGNGGAAVAVQTPLTSTSAAISSVANSHDNGVLGACESRPAGSALAGDIAQALAAGESVVYNNAYDTRRTVPVERSDVVALQQGDISISTLQVWPEGHTLCLSDRVMARALLSGHNGMPAWLQARSAAAAAATAAAAGAPR
ncbi:hypothetical protein HYH02_000176 [Chlamydomonas schloesseri]|uniref:Survival protein SurE-like phosphatase/nucleotidase domain-containing protein n=1 Tax=Chlamydomonas schloesseri TaxID=2026947 RepID=A0A835WLY8_9CHLO|nr:hypothetical protein HYH02_000176 [Chlamydomonas schloesseri]|eukprot:KAG2450072.1 hypothetical protein HYH02_000176 [Chlamydomonas schloesseri]